MLVSWTDYAPSARFDGIPWDTIIIEESVDNQVTWNTIDTLAIDRVDPDPTQPVARSFSTENASSELSWFRISFTDSLNNRIYTEPIKYAATEILASIDDINGNLDSTIIRGDLNNTSLIQISVARTIRANLSQVVPTDILFGWTTPDNTPEIIREIASKMIAGQLYMQQVSRSGQLIPDEHYGAKKYQEGLDLLGRIVSGEIILMGTDGSGVIETPSDNLTDEDFFPTDATNRAFTMGMEL